MNNAIFKYRLLSLDTQLVLPYGAIVLSVKNQNNSPVLYVEQDYQAPDTELRFFQGFLTGSNEGMPENRTFIDTFIDNDHTFVTHWYEVKK